MELQLNIIKIIHPVTYINKILVFSSSQLLLINPITQKLLFDYSVTITPILALSTKITLITTTPLLDMVALGLTSGQIPILNLRTSKIIFTMKQKHSVTALAFNSSDSLMASGDEIGNIILWDL
jgi:U3 small nucleolar RNA-associated protein 21